MVWEKRSFFLGQPKAVEWKPRFEKHSSGLAKDGSRGLTFGKLVNVKKGLQHSQSRREKGSNDEVCADPLIHEWVQVSKERIVGLRFNSWLMIVVGRRKIS